MFLKMIHLFRNKRYSIVLFLLILLLTACAPAPSSTLLKFTEITVSPDPLIGQVATLHLEFISDYDQPLATVDIYLPEGIKLVKGNLAWKGSLTANQTQTHEIAICTSYPGEWWIDITGRLWVAEGNALFTEPRTVLLNVAQSNAEVVMDKNYADFVRPTPTFGPAILPTALPIDWVSPCP
ncbi:MAG TPA: hypothetical protein PK530_24100 [Anaerolineales bacterium]|nr:hypothetical protein [Anaerolineales bacterium]